MRVCLVYDCLFPYTVGGAERWYRALAERLATDGHEVTYLTRRQWARGEEPDAPAASRVVAVGPRLARSTRADGRRRIVPPLRLRRRRPLATSLRHGGRYDVVHTASFPYFSLLAAAAARAAPRATDSSSTGSSCGRAPTGASTSAGSAAASAGCPARLRARSRTRVLLLAPARRGACARRACSGEVTVLEGLYAGAARTARPRRPAEPLVVFAGRHIPEKRVPALIAARARWRASDPRPARRDPRRRARARSGAGGDRRARARATRGRGAGLRRHRGGRATPSRGALCMVLPSRREGYGLVVVEAAARGTPSVVVRDPDNAATELVEDGRQRLRGAQRRRRERPRRRDRARPRRRARRCATRPPTGSPPTRRRLSLDASLDARARELRAPPSARS